MSVLFVSLMLPHGDLILRKGYSIYVSALYGLRPTIMGFRFMSIVGRVQQLKSP